MLHAIVHSPLYIVKQTGLALDMGPCSLYRVLICCRTAKGKNIIPPRGKKHQRCCVKMSGRGMTDVTAKYALWQLFNVATHGIIVELE